MYLGEHILKPDRLGQSCEICRDETGKSVYPSYGAGPHICGWRMGKPVVGYSKGLPVEKWPPEFVVDPECLIEDAKQVSVGTWVCCPSCGGYNARIPAPELWNPIKP